MLAGSMLGLHLPLVLARQIGGPECLAEMSGLLAAGMRLGFRITGARVEVQGREHLVRGERYVVLANHQGLSDVVVLHTVLGFLRLRYVAKRSLARGWPSISYMIRAAGSVAIDRGDPTAAMQAIEGLGREACRRGWSVAIFPEGTRARDGRMREWKPRGTQVLVSAARCRILPVSLYGGHELFAHRGLPFRPKTRLACRVHPPMDPPGEGEDFHEWFDTVRHLVELGCEALARPLSEVAKLP